MNWLYISIVFVEGLPKVRTHEVILFETGQKAEVFSINRGKIEARIFSHEPVRVGTKGYLEEYSRIEIL